MEKPKILIVDDKESNLFVLKRLLKDFDVDLVFAQSGNEALKETITQRFALALIDVQMPEMDGYETAQLIMEDEETRFLPIIFVSAVYRDDYHQIKGFETGAIDFLIKPIVPTILKSKVRIFIELFKQKQALEQENKKRTEAENKANQANLAKSLFLAKMSHEIRTPINSISGLTNILLDGNLNHEERQSLEIIKKSSENLLGIVNNILDLSKIEANKLELEKIDFNIRDLIYEVAHLIQPSISFDQIEFVIEEDPLLGTYYQGDALRVKQILINLLGNSVKFTKNGSIELKVSVKSSKENLSIIQFVIKDSGKGISEEYMKDLYSIFSQEDNTITRTHGGTGLGLAITYNLVQMMGGDMEVQTQVEEGSEFIVRIPFEHASEKGAQCLESYKSKLSSKKLVAIHKSKKLLTSLQNICDAVDIELVPLDSFMALMDYWPDSDKKADLFLLDVTDLEHKGIEILENYRKENIIKDAPILTTSQNVPNKVTSQKNSTHPIILKPICSQPIFQELFELLAEDSVNADISCEKNKKPTIKEFKKTLSFQEMHILIAEDNEDNRFLLDKILGVLGCQYKFAFNGQEACELSAEQDFDLILMDIEMPDMDGYEATRIIRKRGSKIPILGLSAHAMKEYQEKALSSGMDDFISKPFQMEELKRKLERYWAQDSENPTLS